MYDLIVLGGGPAGGPASEKAAEEGLKTLLIEERHLGGVCLNEGCIPSKQLLYCAQLYHHAKDSESYGVKAQSVTFDFAAAMARKNKLIERLRKAQESSKKKRHVEIAFGHGDIMPEQNGLFRVKVADQVHEGQRLLICTGSEAIRIPIPGGDQKFVYTNREMLDIDFIPQKLVIIGGGVIGLEFATLFSEIGSQVTIIEMLPGIAGTLDSEIRTLLQKELEKKGVVIKLNARVTAVGDHTVEFEDADKSKQSVPADIVLMSVGRKPNVRNIGLENLSVALERGAIKTDLQGRTSVPNCYAAGDVNGKVMLAHTATREAEVVVDTIKGHKNAVRYETIPSVIYTHPEVASIGLTKEQAQEKGREVIVANLPMVFSGRYMAEVDNGRGMVKAVIDKEFGTILGMHMIGAQCSEMIHGATIMVESELRVKDVRDIVFPHPTVAEVMRDAIAGVKL